MVRFIYIIAVASYSYYNQNVLKIGKGLDSDYRVCGIDRGVEDYPFTYFTNPDKNYLYQTVCVMECPQIKNEIKQLKCATTQIVNSCEEKHSIYQPKENRLIYDTFVFKNNVCIPKNVVYFNQISESYTPYQIYKFFVVDLQNTKWSTVFGTTLLTFLICLFFWILLQQTNKHTHLFRIYQQIILFFFFVLASFYTLKTYNDYSRDDQSNQTPSEITEKNLTKKQDMFSFLLHLIFSSFYTSFFIVGEFLFFINQTEFQDASYIFQITHLEEQKQKINGFLFFNIIFQSLGYIALILVFEFVILQTLACHDTEKVLKIGPFQQNSPNIIAYTALGAVLLGFLILVLYVRYIYHSTFQIFIQFYESRLYTQQDNQQQSQLWLTLQQLWQDFNKDIIEIVCQGSNITSLLCIPYSLVKKLYVLESSEKFKNIGKYKQFQASKQFEEINQISSTYFFILIIVITMVVSSIMLQILSFNYYLSEVYSLAPATILSSVIAYNMAQIFFMQYESTLQSFLYVNQLNENKKIDKNTPIIKVDERISQTLTQIKF